MQDPVDRPPIVEGQFPSVSVVIPARDAAASIGRAVESSLAQQYPGSIDVVVASADPATTAAVADDPRVTVVSNEIGTTPAGLNQAIRASAGEIIVRCDAHSVLPAGYIERAVTTMQQTGAVNVGGRQIPVGSTFFERAVALAMTSRIGAGDARYRVGGEPGPVDTVFLGVYERAALERLGGFDPNAIRNQDYELNVRIRASGGMVWFDPALGVTYQPRRSLRELWRQYYAYGRGKRTMLGNHPESLRWRQAGPPLLVLALASGTIAGLLGVRAAWIVPLGYLAATVGWSVVDGLRHRDAAAIMEPLTLWTMHIAWGAGFLRGPFR